MSVPEPFAVDPVDVDDLLVEGDDERWESDVESAAEEEAVAGPVWEDIEHRWGAKYLPAVPSTPTHWAELWRALPEAGGAVTVVIATAVEGEFGPEPVLVEQREFVTVEDAKRWAEGWSAGE